MTAKKVIAPELLAEAKRLYEQTAAPVGDIAAMLDLSRSNFYERVREGKWRSRQAKPTFSLARVMSGAVYAEAANDVPVPSGSEPEKDVAVEIEQQRIIIAQRILAVAGREMDAIEAVLKTIKPGDLLEAEHSARTLASLSRTLRDIAALNKSDDEEGKNDADDDADPVPLDIDEFRNELARRIRGLIERRRAERRIHDGVEGSLA